eukprot:GHVL01004592.1.p1 GENE.GHVL01004592.1~~GHVL01004592.1.p1  ORF type:complete len:280 (+),score=53.30 GHVL01004592.1:69-908(+)
MMIRRNKAWADINSDDDDSRSFGKQLFPIKLLPNPVTSSDTSSSRLIDSSRSGLNLQFKTSIRVSENDQSDFSSLMKDTNNSNSTLNHQINSKSVITDSETDCSKSVTVIADSKTVLPDSKTSNLNSVTAIADSKTVQDSKKIFQMNKGPPSEECRDDDSRLSVKRKTSDAPRSPAKRQKSKNITSLPCSKNETVNQDAHKVQQRTRQIAYSMMDKCYQTYVRHIPREKREKHHPSTPDPRRKVSQRQWQEEFANWKRQLHKVSQELEVSVNLRDSPDI